MKARVSNDVIIGTVLEFISNFYDIKNIIEVVDKKGTYSIPHLHLDSKIKDTEIIEFFDNICEITGSLKIDQEIFDFFKRIKTNQERFFETFCKKLKTLKFSWSDSRILRKINIPEVTKLSVKYILSRKGKREIEDKLIVPKMAHLKLTVFEDGRRIFNHSERPDNFINLFLKNDLRTLKMPDYILSLSFLHNFPHLEYLKCEEISYYLGKSPKHFKKLALKKCVNFPNITCDLFVADDYLRFYKNVNGTNKVQLKNVVNIKDFDVSMCYICNDASFLRNISLSKSGLILYNKYMRIINLEELDNWIRYFSLNRKIFEEFPRGRNLLTREQIKTIRKDLDVLEETLDAFEGKKTYKLEKLMQNIIDDTDRNNRRFDMPFSL